MKQPTPSQPVTERVYDLLLRNPALRPVDLMKLAQCGKTTASRARITYFQQHPDQAALATPARQGKSVTERVCDLLSLNPTLSTRELMKLAECSESAATKGRRAYFQQHPERVPSRQTVTARIYNLLEADPTLRPVDLWKQVGCHQALASRARIAYFVAHPEREAPARQAEREV